MSDIFYQNYSLLIVACAIPAAATAAAAAATTALWAVETDSVEEFGKIAEAEFIDVVGWEETDGTTSTKLFKSEFEKLALCLPLIWSFNVSFREYKYPHNLHRNLTYNIKWFQFYNLYYT